MLWNPLLPQIAPLFGWVWCRSLFPKGLKTAGSTCSQCPTPHAALPGADALCYVTFLPPGYATSHSWPGAVPTGAAVHQLKALMLTQGSNPNSGTYFPRALWKALLGCQSLSNFYEMRIIKEPLP